MRTPDRMAFPWPPPPPVANSELVGTPAASAACCAEAGLPGRPAVPGAPPKPPGLPNPPGPPNPPPPPSPPPPWVMFTLVCGGCGTPPGVVALDWVAPVSRSNVDIPLSPPPGAIWFAAVSIAPPPPPRKMSLSRRAICRASP